MKSIVVPVVLAAVLIAVPRAMRADQIHDAAAKGDVETINTLLAADDSLMYEKDENGKTPLHWAAAKGQVAVLKLLVEDFKMKIDTRNGDGGTPMHAAVSQEQMESVKYLLDHSADVNAKRTTGGGTPLHVAAAKGGKTRIAIAGILIEKGADVNAKMDNGMTPLILAAFRKDDEMTALLEKNKAAKSSQPVGKAGLSIHEAAAEGDVDTVKLLLDQDKKLMYEKDENGKTPLHWAAAKGQVAVLKLLVEDYKMEIDARNGDGGTPMHAAVSQDQKESVKFLIKHKADVNAKRKTGGGTPLHVAALKGGETRVAIAGLLIAEGADVNAKMDNGMTPLSLASLRGNTGMVELLREHGATPSQTSRSGGGTEAGRSGSRWNRIQKQSEP
jgi:ankyrin repeat protein